MSFLLNPSRFIADVGGGVTFVGGSLTQSSASRVSSLGITLPAGSVEGDTAIMTSSGFDDGRYLASPAGWTIDFNAVTNFGTLICHKVLTGADITAGSVTVSVSGSATYMAITMAVFSGSDFTVTSNAANFDVQVNTNTTNTKTLTSGGVVVACFGSAVGTSGTYDAVDDLIIAAEAGNGISHSFIGYAEITTSETISKTVTDVPTNLNKSWCQLIELTP